MDDDETVTPLTPENVNYLLRRLQPIITTLEAWADIEPRMYPVQKVFVRDDALMLKVSLNEFRKELERTHTPQDAPNSRFVVPGD